MLLIDVNVLIYAHRADAADHVRYRTWLEQTLDSDSLCGVSDLILSAVVRVVTHPRILRRPTPLPEALQYVEWLRGHPRCLPISPGQRHWDLFTRLCRSAEVRGALVTDAYFAALAIEAGAEWITTDRDYARFAGLRWRHPLE